MANGKLETVLRHLHKLAEADTAKDLTDGQLLERFRARGEETAFAQLVQRHGPMVLATCRRALSNLHDAEDAFQATFLVLARKADSIRKQQSLGSWLYGVACRIAAKARAQACRRQQREKQAAAMKHSEPVGETTWQELRAVLDEELGRLAEKYRAPVVLCYLEGKTHEQAASELRCPRTSLSSRLGRARELLRQRLSRRGIALSAGLLATALTEKAAPAAVPALLVIAAVQAATPAGTGKVVAAGVVSERVVSLAKEVMQATSLTRIKAGVVLLLALAGAGTGVCGYLARAERPPEPAQEEARGPIEKGVERAETSDPKPPRMDRHGDRLPPGAVARFGTTRFRSAHTIHYLAFGAGGTRLIGSTWDNVVYVWDGVTGKALRQIEVPDAWRNAVAVSPDGAVLAAGGRDKDRRLRLWETATGKEVFRSPPLESTVGLLRFSPDGKTLAGMSGKVIRLWDARTGKELAHFAAEGGPVKALFFGADARLLAAGWHDGTIRLWDTATGKERQRFVTPQADVVRLALSPDGKVLASGGGENDRTVCLWDVATGKKRHRFDRYAGWVESIGFAPDGKRVAVGDQLGTIHLYDVASGRERWERRLPGDGGWVLAVVFSPDGKTLASSSTDHVARLWDVTTGKEVAVATGHADGVTGVSVAPDDQRVVTASPDRTLRCWDAATGAESWRVEGEGGAFSSPTFSPDGTVLAAAGPRHVIRLWDAATGKARRQLVGPGGGGGAISRIAFAPDGKTLASVGHRDDSTLRLWDVATGKELPRLTGKTDGFLNVAFSPDGRLLAASAFGVVVLFDRSTGRERCRLRQNLGYAGSLAFSADSRLLAAGSGPGLIVWELASGRELLRVKGLPRWLNSVAFSPDGRTLVSGGADNTVRLWDVLTGKELHRFTGHLGQGHLGGVNAVAFAPDGKTVLSAGDDTTALVWNVADLRPEDRPRTADLRPAELEAFWTDLAGEDVAKAHRAVWALAATARQSVPFLKDRLRPTVPADPERIARLVRDLDRDRFAVREKATAELEKLGEAARPALQQVLAGRPTAEVRFRVRQVLEKLEGPVLSGKALRTVRAIAVLEHADTRAARQVLEALAQGMPGTRSTAEARHALERLKR
jgi:RNA polymerase sigma factor (sigma-70 family)